MARSTNSPGDMAALARAISPLPPSVWWELGQSILICTPRSVADDCERLVGYLQPAPRVEGAGMIPPREPFLLVANHLQASNLWIGWVAATITAAVARARGRDTRNLHWVVLSEWRWFELGRLWVPNPVSSLIFPRAARCWGLIPMPSRPTDVAGRAAAVRRMLAFLGQGHLPHSATGEPVAMFPEGRASFALLEALPGTGSLLHMVSRLGIPLLPAGGFPSEGRLVIRFGPPFRLESPPTGDIDGWARRRVMAAIARLLPPTMWGAYTSMVEGPADGS